MTSDDSHDFPPVDPHPASAPSSGADLHEKLRDAEDRLLRTQAELENFR